MSPALTPPSPSRDCIILGAGIAGLMAGQCLYENFSKNILILDKGRGVGGRLATRRLKDVSSNPPQEASQEAPSLNHVFDHGAQFFTVKSPEMAEFVQQWLTQGLLYQWFEGPPLGVEELKDIDGPRQFDEFPRYCVTGGMAQLAKALAKNLEVFLNCEIKSIQLITTHTGENSQCLWQLEDLNGTHYQAHQLIITAPVPQAVTLLKTTGLDFPELAALEAVRYAPCIALLMQVDSEFNLPDTGALRLEGEPVAWAANNHKKGIYQSTSSLQGVTLHAGPQFSQEAWDWPESKIKEILLEAVSFWFPGRNIQDVQVKKWRYSLVETPYLSHQSLPYLKLKAPASLYLAGDGYSKTSRVEASALSGLLCAKALIQETEAFSPSSTSSAPSI
ncbi:MAG: FAD-dependent oxidoreductase [Cyanobacteria bacterium]|nr:FAD-dependent oxidoreductase [Cyanobacteriota bacterium]